VLPAAVRRQQRFRQRTVWNIVAALLAVALLAWHWQTTRAQVDQATANLQRVRTAQSIAKSVSDEVGTLVENNKKDRAVVDLLAEKAVPLHGALRVLRAVTKDLPAQCWLRKFEIRQGNNAGTAHGLEFLVSGSAKEIDGVDPQGPFTEYSRSLHQDQLLKPLLDSKQAELSMQPKSPGATLVEFELTFKFGVAAAADTKGPK
jgi:type II secretory pathway pseudopilin PulG